MKKLHISDTIRIKSVPKIFPTTWKNVDMWNSISRETPNKTKAIRD